MFRHAPVWLGFFVVIAQNTSPAAEAPANGPQVPVSLAWGSGERLFVALRDAQAVATVDTRTWEVSSRIKVGFRPTHVALADDNSTLLIGGMDGQFAALAADRQIICSVTLGRGPVRILSLGQGRAAVACLWDDSVLIVDARDGGTLARHPLPFSPRAMTRRPDGRVVVADAFGGGLADLDPGVAGSERTRTLDAVNVQGMAISGDGKELLVVHMAQYDAVPITQANIDWGLVLTSRLTAVRLTDFDAGGTQGGILPRRSLKLDGSRHGAADPSALAVTPDGSKVLITLAGAHQLLLNDRKLGAPFTGPTDLLPLGHNQRLNVRPVGRSPVALVLDRSGSIAVTADAMSDTLSVVSVADYSLVRTVHLSPGRVVKTAAQRGEALFHDGRRAMDSWITCASCHTAAHTNGLNFDTLGDGSYGAAKNTPSLLGVGHTAPFAWTGDFAKLTEQVHQSLLSSMHGPTPDDETVEDLTAYLESLDPPPPRRDSRDPAAARGSTVFSAERCDGCHRPPQFTLDAVRDVGLDDGPGGHRRFNPPSLRGVSRTAPYLHDGRAKTLTDVLEVHHPGRTAPLRARDRDDLVAYLESL